MCGYLVCKIWLRFGTDCEFWKLVVGGVEIVRIRPLDFPDSILEHFVGFRDASSVVG